MCLRRGILLKIFTTLVLPVGIFIGRNLSGTDKYTSRRPSGDIIFGALNSTHFFNVSLSPKCDSISNSRQEKDIHDRENGLLMLLVSLWTTRDGPHQYSPIQCVSPNLFDSRFHQDFITTDDSGTQYQRGREPYQRPVGYRRYALNVLGKYEDDAWLGANGKRSSSNSSVPNEWPVGYHGTSFDNALAIAIEGYDISKSKQKNAFGPGIYTSPHIDTAFHSYALPKHYEFCGERYAFVLQNRVNIANVRVHKTAGGETVWVAGDKNDVRPYGILAWKVKDTQYLNPLSED